MMIRSNRASAAANKISSSGGYAGFSAGVTGGVASESSSGQSSSNKTYSKRMIANYMVSSGPLDLWTQRLRQQLIEMLVPSCLCFSEARGSRADAGAA